jgi:hypothetical protein
MALVFFDGAEFDFQQIVSALFCDLFVLVQQFDELLY